MILEKAFEYGGWYGILTGWMGICLLQILLWIDHFLMFGEIDLTPDIVGIVIGLLIVTILGFVIGAIFGVMYTLVITTGFQSNYRWFSIQVSRLAIFLAILCTIFGLFLFLQQIKWWQTDNMLLIIGVIMLCWLLTIPFVLGNRKLLALTADIKRKNDDKVKV